MHARTHTQVRSVCGGYHQGPCPKRRLIPLFKLFLRFYSFLIQRYECLYKCMFVQGHAGTGVTDLVTSHVACWVLSWSSRRVGSALNYCAISLLPPATFSSHCLPVAI